MTQPTQIKKGGDKVIWWITLLLLLWSFLAVLSTSAMKEVGSITIIFRNYFLEVLFSLFVMWLVYKFDYKYYKKLSWAGMFITVGLLVIALATGKTIGGQNAARWISIAGVNFQPSYLAIIALVVFTARFLSIYNKKGKEFFTLTNNIFQLWGWVLAMFAMILVANLSTAIILMMTFYAMLFIGNYPMKYLLGSMGGLFLAAVIAILLALAFPQILEGSRTSTWTARIERHLGINDGKTAKEQTDEDRQIIESKTAIAFGATSPKGPGKSIQKYFLPQADNDFLFAILVEEYSVLGGLFIIFLYAVFIIRAFFQVNKTDDLFGKFIICGITFVLSFQAIVHMGVTVGVFPVTGQNLPFISSGGTSVLTACIAVGLIQNVVKRSRERAAAILEAQLAFEEKESTHPAEPWAQQGKDFEIAGEEKNLTIEDIIKKDEKSDH